MKVKLKTLEQLEEEFGFKFYESRYLTKFNNMDWWIDKDMFEYLGKEIEVKKIDGSRDYTHCGIINHIKWGWHELWFEPEFVPIEFIKENEFEL